MGIHLAIHRATILWVVVLVGLTPLTDAVRGDQMEESDDEPVPSGRGTALPHLSEPLPLLLDTNFVPEAPESLHVAVPPAPIVPRSPAARQWAPAGSRQLLSAVGSSLCRVTAHACRKGCECSWRRRWLPHCSDGAADDTGAKLVDIHGTLSAPRGSICSEEFPALFAVVLASPVVVLVGGLLFGRALRRDKCSQCMGDARKLGLRRAELEARIRAATKLTPAQRQAVLDRFCVGDEVEQAASTPNCAATGAAGTLLCSARGNDKFVVK